MHNVNTLLSLLEDERQLILTGKIDALHNLADAKSQALLQLRSSGLSQTQISRLQTMTARNQGLLAAAAEGIALRKTGFVPSAIQIKASKPIRARARHKCFRVPPQVSRSARNPISLVQLVGNLICGIQYSFRISIAGSLCIQTDGAAEQIGLQMSEGKGSPV